MYLSIEDAVELYGKRFESVQKSEIALVIRANGLPCSYKELVEEVFQITFKDNDDSFQDLIRKVNLVHESRAFMHKGFLILKKRFTVKNKKFSLNIRYGYKVEIDISNFEDKEIDLIEFLMKDQISYLEGLKEKVCATIRTISRNLRDEIAYKNALLERNEFMLALSDLRDNYEISQSQIKILEKNLDFLSGQDKDLLNEEVYALCL